MKKIFFCKAIREDYFITEAGSGSLSATVRLYNMNRDMVKDWVDKYDYGRQFDDERGSTRYQQRRKSSGSIAER